MASKWKGKSFVHLGESKEGYKEIDSWLGYIYLWV